jgi:hypothetical protein
MRTDIVAGIKVRVTPDPAFFTDPGDYQYVMREEGINGGVYTVDSVNEPTPYHDFLPRSGVTTYTLVNDSGQKCFLAVDSEVEPA